MLAYIYKYSLTFINVASHLQMLAYIYKCESTFTNVSSRTLERQMAPHIHNPLLKLTIVLVSLSLTFLLR